MPDILHLDWETASEVDLTKVGLDRYCMPASEPRVLMGAYAINPSSMKDIKHWEAHRGRIPAELKEAIEDPDVQKWCFQAQFERVVAKRLLGLKVVRKNWRCLMALAYMHCFTGGLAEVGKQMRLPFDSMKLKDGKKLLKMFTMPQRVTKNQPHRWRDWQTDPDDWDQFCNYNVMDVAEDMAVMDRLLRPQYPIPDVEWEFYELDQLINDRGIPIDTDFATNLIWMAARRKRELLDEMKEITGVDNPNSGQQLLPWLKQHGYPYLDLRASSIQKALNRTKELWDCEKDVSDDDAPEVVRVLRRREWAAKTSISKADAAMECIGEDLRARYLYQFGGASRTLRFAGRLIQTQNMTRTPKIFDAEHSDVKLTYVTDLIRAGDYDAFDDLFIDEPMMAFTGCMRGMLRAEDGSEFVTADLASIESAVIAWVTNCERLLNVFRTGRDPYLDFGTEFYRKAYEEITRAERQMCKPPALGCGFRLGPGREIDGVKTGLLGYADNMGVPMTLKEATRAVKVYRKTYPEIPEHWYAYEKAIVVVLKTKKPVKVGPVTFRYQKPYMLIELPSGRCIYYYKPRLERRTIWTGKMIIKKVRSRGFFLDGAPKGEIIEIEEEETYVKTIFTYMGRNKNNNQWERLDGHGGVVIENIVQAIARDVLREGLSRLHKLGFYLIGHAHDEAMAMQRKGENYYTKQLMCETMKQPIAWAPGLPLGAAGWTGAFYRK